MIIKKSKRRMYIVDVINPPNLVYVLFEPSIPTSSFNFVVFYTCRCDYPYKSCLCTFDPAIPTSYFNLFNCFYTCKYYLKYMWTFIILTTDGKSTTPLSFISGVSWKRCLLALALFLFIRDNNSSRSESSEDPDTLDTHDVGVSAYEQSLRIVCM